MAGTPVIAVEEHYLDPLIADRLRLPPPIRDRLLDLGEGRLNEMDAAGIDMQVLSHAPPAAQMASGAEAADLARRLNDNLAAVVRGNPDRFAALAALPTGDPAACADEMDRAVSELGFRGAMLHGLTAEVFHDDRRFWPIFQRAAALDVPVYLHPGNPHKAVSAAYYGDYLDRYPILQQAALGFTLEMLTAGIRMVLSGVFDAHPGLKVILGHMGEGLPFLLERTDESLARNTGGVRQFRDIFCRHFWITTSGNFSDPALICSMMEMGADRILFAVDWPFVDNGPAAEWIARAPVSPEDRGKIQGGNARRLLGI